MRQRQGNPRNSIRIEGQKLMTVSHPERSAWWFLGSVMAFVLAVCLLPLMLGEGAPMSAWVVMTATFALSAVFLLWCLLVSRVSMTADSSGIQLHTLRWFRASIPWEAVADVRPDSTGSGLQLGWKQLGGGLTGYLAGTEAVMIEIDDDAARRLSQLEGPEAPPPKRARRYLVSVPQSDLVSLKLRELRGLALPCRSR
ncbi:hypothetical protein [Nesterenkonia muleiensis]|uniref:hypothetical protein n=1 Tax=Nesterenkonia muleiensis TaxID=2282648 RepID=UPI000E76A23A|nr:hypothetical protein [Nesterenkonia muleiensis]